MNKVTNLSKIWLLLALGLATAVFNSCGDDDDPKKDQTVPVAGISVPTPTLTLTVGDEYALPVTVTPENATDKTVTLTSSNPAVVSIADGKLKALATGEVTITAKAGDKTTTCAVTVQAAPIAVTSISLDKTALEFVVGESAISTDLLTLVATVLPDNAMDKTVSWTSSNTAVATVSNEGVVTAVTTAAGTATITAKAGEQTATCTVSIFALPATDGVTINGITWATRNVDAPGTFAANITDYGKFYQWNSSTAWAATGSVEGWDISWNGGFETPSNTDTWDTANNVCPTGYRLPTRAEQESLLNAGSVWTTVNGVKGRVFGSGSKSLFLPAAGYRYGSNGTLSPAAGESGNFYWSSETLDADYAYCLYFHSNDANRLNGSRALGFSARCVAE
ncbi:hypothetical protein FACS189434_06080 [Bacteroidia bacterium]|nr:hypothetical protein FACS189434_06080 [Bacteroidia bacterium]